MNIDPYTALTVAWWHRVSAQHLVRNVVVAVYIR